MNYYKGKDYIEIFGKEDFDIKQILECGQVFSYQKKEESYLVFSADKKAEVFENEKGYVIKTGDTDYFENYFDLKTDYGKIKNTLSKYAILKDPIKFGSGIRILKQNLFETLISFIVSANNNIKRIQLILNRLREKLGENMGSFHAFPTREELLTVDVSFFKEIGAGYRDKYLHKVVRQIDEKTLYEWGSLPTKELRKNLISLAGVGPKVADCILLFGYGKGDVFPVDTWIKKMYNKYYDNIDNREKIRNNLTSQFGDLSGYAQQYLFNFMRAN